MGTQVIKDMKTYTVHIAMKHCAGATYTNPDDCPLARAIKEQLTGFMLYRVGAGHLLDQLGNDYKFTYGSWNKYKMDEIVDGHVDTYSVSFSGYEEKRKV